MTYVAVVFICIGGWCPEINGYPLFWRSQVTFTSSADCFKHIKDERKRYPWFLVMEKTCRGVRVADR